MEIVLTAQEKLSLAELHFRAQIQLRGDDTAQLAELAQMMAAERFCAVNAGVTSAEAHAIRVAAEAIVKAQRWR